MDKIMNIISSETHGKSFKTFKYCFDGIEVPTLSYDDHKILHGKTTAKQKLLLKPKI